MNLALVRNLSLCFGLRDGRATRIDERPGVLDGRGRTGWLLGHFVRIGIDNWPGIMNHA